MQRLPAERVPDTSEALAVWARAQFDAGKHEDAVTGYSRAIDKNPDDAQLSYSRAIAMKYAAGGKVTPQIASELVAAAKLADKQDDPKLRATISAS